MTEAGHRLGLLPEPVEERRVLVVEGRQDLDGDVSVEVRVVGPKNRGHAAAANLLDEHVASEGTTGRYGDHYEFTPDADVD